MFKDIRDFLVIYMIITISFSIGFSQIYSKYDGMVLQVPGEEKEEMSDGFTK